MKVGIIGAGVGGLYAAMMLQSLDIDYEILEASEVLRVASLGCSRRLRSTSLALFHSGPILHREESRQRQNPHAQGSIHA